MKFHENSSTVNHAVHLDILRDKHDKANSNCFPEFLCDCWKAVKKINFDPYQFHNLYFIHSNSKLIIFLKINKYNPN
jgi:hypothetical protein